MLPGLVPGEKIKAIKPIADHDCLVLYKKKRPQVLNCGPPEG
jgi:hypothetical protein